MQTIAVIIPTFHRVKSLEAIARNVHNNTQSHTLYFVCEPDDQASIDEVNQLNELLILNKQPGTHTGAANTAYYKTSEPFFIIANDDFNFHPGWDVAALAKMNEGHSVIGLNDGGSDSFTQITLVRRSYIEEQSGCIDLPNTLYFPGYNHNFVDTEFAQTAMKRGVFAICKESVVEHMHWTYGKAVKDATYEKSFKTSPVDQRLFESRKHLWET